MQRLRPGVSEQQGPLAAPEVRPRQVLLRVRRGLLLLRQILLPPSLRRRTLKKDDDQRIKIALKVIL